MKKKLLMLSLALISCVCVAVGFSACGEETHTHDLTPYAAVDATCTEDGNIAYWYCSDCGKYFSDANGTTEISQADTVVSALGHDYEINFSWTETNGVWTATATRTCANDSTDTETVTAVVTEKENSRTEADCTTAGSVTYIATATFSDNTNETEEKPVTIPATGHTYSDDWTTDGSAHWHAATCEHTTEVSDYAAHTFVADSNGDYVCSVCGYKVTTVVNSYGSLALGDNYVVLGSSDTYPYILSLTYTVTVEGYYTVSVPEGCQAFVDVENSFGQEYELGYTDSTDTLIYSAVLPALVGDTITISYIGFISDVTTDSDYIFSINISCEEKTVVLGTEEAPYALSLAGTQDQEVTIEAGSSCYFTLTGSSLSSVYVSSSALKLYQVGDEGDTLLTTYSDGTYYCYYFKPSYGSTYTFYLKNDTESSITDTIHFYMWSPDPLTEGTNTITLATSQLTNGTYIQYKLTVYAGYDYTVTLGTGSDENVGIKAVSTSGSYVLGAGATATEYTFTQTSDSTKSFYIYYSGDATTFTVVINISKEETPVVETPTVALTLDTASTATAISATSNVVNYTYTPTTTGYYILTLSGDSSIWETIASYYLTLKLNNSTVSGSNGVYVLSLTAGTAYTLELTSNSGSQEYNLTATLNSDSAALSTSETAQTLNGGTTYVFIATAGGSYKFSAGSDSDIIVTDGSYSCYYDLYSGGSYGEDDNGLTTTLTLSAGDVIYIYCYYSDATCSITITQASAGGGDENTDDKDNLTVGSNNIVLTADEASDGYNATFTATAIDTYIFTISADENACVRLNNNMMYTLSSSGTLTLEFTTTSENQAITVTLWSNDSSAATYTLKIEAKSAKYQTLTTGSNTLTLVTDDETTYYAYTIYNATTAGSYYFTLGSSNSMFAYYVTAAVTVNGTEVTGSSFVYDVTLVAGENVIVVAYSGSVMTNWSFTLTLAEGESPKTEVPDSIFAVGTYDISISAADGYYGVDKSYTITADQAGTYMLSIDSSADAYLIIYVYDADGYTDSSAYLYSYSTSFIFTVAEGYEVTINYATYSYGAATYKLYVAEGKVYAVDETITLTEDDATCLVNISEAGDYVLTLTLADGSAIDYTEFTGDYCNLSFTVDGNTYYNYSDLVVSGNGDSCYISFTVDEYYVGNISISFSLYQYSGTLTYYAVVSKEVESIDYVPYSGTVYNISTVSASSVADGDVLIENVLSFASTSDSKGFLTSNSGSRTIDSTTSVYEGVDLDRRVLINTTTGSLTLTVAADSAVTLYYGLGTSASAMTIYSSDGTAVQTLTSDTASSTWNVLYTTVNLTAGTYTISLSSTGGNFAIYSICMLANSATAE